MTGARIVGVRAVVGGAALVAMVLVVGSVGVAGAAVSAGSVYAFGYNEDGELGLPATDEPFPTPTLVSLSAQSGRVTQVAAGEGHSLIATSGGQVFAFGANYEGELGSTTNNGNNNPNSTPTLVSLPGQSGQIAQIAAGSDQSFVVTSSGQLYAFGYNLFGELGIAGNSGTVNPNPTPTLVTLPGQSGRITQVATGDDHSLAVTSSGQLYAFGLNNYGQLGIATNSGTDNANPTPTLVSLPSGSGQVTQVSAGGDHSLALTSSGQLYAFGLNAFGELGNSTNNGTVTANPTPMLVTLPGQSGQITQIAGGEEHSLVATSSGQLYAFGINDSGQLGNKTNNGTAGANPTPTLVTLPGQSGPVTQISAGDDHSLAVTSSGQLYGFGVNNEGQLGTTTHNSTSTANPTPTLVPLPAGTTIDTVAKGPTAESTLALVSGLAIATKALTAGRAGSAYSETLAASGGTAPLTWSATGLPAGLALGSSSGVLSGKPTATGNFTVVVRATDSYGSEATTTLTLTITAASKLPSGPSVLSALRVSPTTFALTGRKVNGRCVKATKLNSADKHCHEALKLSIGYTVNHATRVTLRLKRQAVGRTVAGQCEKPTKKNTSGRKCARLTGVNGKLVETAKAGANHFTFDGKVNGRALTPATYDLTATPADGKPRSTTFKVTS